MNVCPVDIETDIQSICLNLFIWLIDVSLFIEHPDVLKWKFGNWSLYIPNVEAQGRIHKAR